MSEEENSESGPFLKRRPALSAALAIAAAITVYYLIIAVVGAHYSKICHKGENGHIDSCADWDAVTAVIIRLVYWLDRHNGFVVAVATAVVAFFTFFLWRSTEKMWSAGAQQLQLARDEFITTHRPRMRVRNINVKEVGNTKTAGVGLHLPGKQDHFSGQFYVSNVGDQEARITAAYLMFFGTHLLPMERPYEGQNENLTVNPHPIPPGASRPVTFFELLQTDDRSSDTILDPDRNPIYAMGWIEYADPAGTIRRTAFCRQYHSSLRRFVAIDDPDYEHEE